MARQFNLEKQFTFALASALTATAKAAQAAAIADVRTTFTVRTNWLEPSNAMGVKILPAKKDDLSAAVVTRAGWLNKHEDGEDKTPTKGKDIALPTPAAWPNRRILLPVENKPKRIRKRQKFVRQLKDGRKALFARVGESAHARLKLLYIFTKKAQIKQQSTIVEPTLATFEKRFDELFYQKLAQALATAR